MGVLFHNSATTLAQYFPGDGNFGNFAGELAGRLY
jgi:hypothetical protein